MASDTHLFRTEVLDSDGKRAYGDVLLVFPMSNYALVALALALLTALCLLAGGGSYTRHASVAGVLEPDQGVVKLYASQSGILKLALVHEGQQVRKGEVLLVFVSEHVGAEGTAIEAKLDVNLREQLTSLRRELDGTLKLQSASAASARRDLATARLNRDTVDSEMASQAQRVSSAEQITSRYRQLQTSGYMPDMLTQQKNDDLLDQRMRLQELRKQAASADAELARLTAELENGPVREQVAQAQLARSIAGIEAELSKQQNGHEWSVLAPCDGTVASLTIGAHQNAASGVPLATIVPGNGALQAILYAPSRALGFVQPGQNVKLKFDAFPYQKFGIAGGTVLTIADSPVRASENSAGTRLATSAESGEPMYTIRVTLEKQFVMAYGKRQRLRPGMQVDADVELETRRLYEWILEPIYGLRRGGA